MSKKKLGAGLYRVTAETLVYRGQTYEMGNKVRMSDAGAGAHHESIERVEDDKSKASSKTTTKASSSDAKKPASSSGKGSN